MTSNPSTEAALRFAPILARREAELRALLREAAADKSASADDAGEVTDFKDLAAEESLEVVADAKVDHAAHELEQVLAARRRLDEGRFGQCLDCGEPIDERRLSALPAAAYCTACQAIREHDRPQPRHG